MNMINIFDYRIAAYDMASRGDAKGRRIAREQPVERRKAGGAKRDAASPFDPISAAVAMLSS